MGERGYIKTIQDGKPLYFYSHGRGYELEDVVKSALIRAYTYEGHHDEQRWRQPSYLNRIIFSELVRNEVNSVTGYGISLDGFEDDVMITVNHDDRTVTDGEGVKQTYYQFTGMQSEDSALSEKKKLLAEYGITELTDHEISCMVMTVNYTTCQDGYKFPLPKIGIAFRESSGGDYFEVDTEEKRDAVKRLEAILIEQENKRIQEAQRRAFNFGAGAVDNIAKGLKFVKINEFKSRGKRVK